MKLDIILDWLRSIAPEGTAMPDDPVGLLVHPREADVTDIAVCLDATPAVVRQAAQSGAQLLVCHHPLIYAPLRKLRYGDPIADSVMGLVRANLALYAMHTNWDAASGGVNDTLAKLLGLVDVAPLGECGEECLPRIGRLPAMTTVSGLAKIVRGALDVAGRSSLRYDESLDDVRVERVAVCGGAGASLAGAARARGADAFVTSDVRHHEFVDASARSFPLFDAGHGATEAPGMAALADRLGAQFPALTVSFIE